MQAYSLRSSECAPELGAAIDGLPENTWPAGVLCWGTALMHYRAGNVAEGA
jgi:hypothetical protein